MEYIVTTGESKNFEGEPNEIMKDIVKTTGGKKTVLSKIFDAEAIRGFNAMSSEYQRTGGFGSLDKFMQIQSTGKVLTADSARLAKTGNSQITAGTTFLTDKADTAVNNILNEGLGSLFKGKTRKYMTNQNGGEQAQTSKVELQIKSDTPVVVKSIKSKNIDVTVDSGLSMGVD